jgi:hypothetical protein
MKPNTCLIADENVNYANSLFLQKIHALEAITDKLPVVVIVHQLEPLIVKYMSPNGLKILGFSLQQIDGNGRSISIHVF